MFEQVIPRRSPRRHTVAALLTGSLAALAVPAAALADTPPGTGLVSDDRFSCDNGATIIVHSAAGPSAWIDDAHYLVASRTLTFTDGSTDVQTQGEKSGLTDTITCTAQLERALLSLTLVRVPPAE